MSCKTTLFILLSLLLAQASTHATETVQLNWLGDNSPSEKTGISFGVPWPKGKYQKNTEFNLKDSDGKTIAVSTWPMAYWPDGSLKWSGCSVSTSSNFKTPFLLSKGKSKHSQGIKLKNGKTQISIDNGTAIYQLAKTGEELITSITIDGLEVGRKLSLIAHIKDSPEILADNVKSETYKANFSKVQVEQKSSVRVLVKAEGTFKGVKSNRELLPFTLRLYFNQAAQQVRMVFSFVYDGDQKKDFIAGLGMTIQAPLRKELINRHLMFAGSGEGVWHEPVIPLTGRMSGMKGSRGLFKKQLLGEEIPSDFLNTDLKKLIEEVAHWDAYKLQQNSSDAFTIHKRTGTHSSWIKANHGDRSRGLAFIGDTSGGIALGLRDFWQTFPSAIEVKGMTTKQADMTLWFWSPGVAPMDMRHYSDRGHGLSGAYEDYQENHATPFGVARTFELNLWPRKSVPQNRQLSELADQNSNPPMLICTPEYYHSIPVFGKWSLRDTSTPSRRWIEDKIDLVLDFYKKEIEQRRWYGFWDFGDVMHQYDAPRHAWKYDIGGFAWQNTELVPDMMLWYSFLRTGRADIYRMAEAMTRQTQEVDVYHMGPLKGLGSRHNVSHWGGGAKEARIAMAGLKRFYYYISTDERMGDLIDEVVDADKAIVITNPLRKILPRDEHPTHARIGPDWVSFVSNWMAAWEKTGDPKYRDKIINGMKSISSMPQGIFSDDFFGYHPETQTLHLLKDKTRKHKPSHMVSIFGGAETMVEVMELIDDPEWTQTWLEFCERYSWSEEHWSKSGNTQGHAPGGFIAWNSRLTAYAAYAKQDKAIAARAWDEFLNSEFRDGPPYHPLKPERVTGSDVLAPLQEMDGTAGTNHYSQWVLVAIENLELIGEYLPKEIKHK